MCIAIVGKIVEKEGLWALVDIGGAKQRVGLHLLQEAEVEDFVMVHAGFAIEKWDEERALMTLSLLKELESTDVSALDEDSKGL